MSYRPALFLRCATIFVLALLLIPAHAFAYACSSPNGNAGDQFYNTTYNIMEYCNGTSWVSMSGGGASASAGGSNGQVEYNNAGSLGGFTVSGDCTLVTSSGVITCTKTNGTALAASATVNATNAGNITSGTLGAAEMPALTGDVTTTVGTVATTAVKLHGVAYAASPSTNTVPVITGSNTATYEALPSCTDSSGNHLNYNTSTNAFSCGTSSSSTSSQWTTSGSNIYYTTGSVGIDTTTINAPLEIVNTSAGAATTGILLNNFGTAANTEIQVRFAPSNSDTTRYSYISGLNEGSNAIDLIFGVANGAPGAEKMRLNYNGYLGIGTNSPSNALDVNGSVTVEGRYIYIADGTGAVNTTGGPLLYADSGNWGIKTGSGNGGVNFQNYAGSTTAYIATANGSYISGNIGIGTTNPGSYLLLVGSASASGAIVAFVNSSGTCTHNPGSGSETVSCSSDIRLKKDIVNAAPALEGLADMRIHEYTVRSTGERKTGVIAQEMLETHPAMVHMDKTGYYTVDEPNPWKLVKAIQELKALNDKQGAEIDRLQQEIDELKSGQQ